MEQNGQKLENTLMCLTDFAQNTVSNKTVYYKLFYFSFFGKMKAEKLQMVRWLLRVRRETTQEINS